MFSYISKIDIIIIYIRFWLANDLNFIVSKIMFFGLEFNFQEFS